ncbi:MAG TPA: hypothetical protein PKD54_06440 [Pirellulaceae bacterium]|nr:hypothetical protein [Pirellulaceae bacterium]
MTFGCLFRLVSILSCSIGLLVGCHGRPDQSIRNAFNRFYSAHTTQLIADYDQLYITCIAKSPTSRFATICRGESSHAHTAIEIWHYPVAQDPKGYMDLAQLLNESLAHETDEPRSTLYRNDRYAFSLSSSNRLSSVRMAIPGKIKPHLDHAMFPIASVSLGIRFCDLVHFNDATFSYFGESQSLHFPECYELRLDFLSEFDGKVRSGVVQYFFDKSTALAVGHISSEMGQPPHLLQRCSIVNNDLKRRTLFIESFQLIDGRQEVREQMLFNCEQRAPQIIERTLLSWHGIPEPVVASNSAATPWALIFWGLFGVCCLLVGGFIRSCCFRYK